MTGAAVFWNRFANRYAARQIRDVASHEAMLADAAGRLRPADRVLEIGCGTGSIAIRLAPGVARYVATDFSDAMIRIARSKPAPPNLHLEVADAADLPAGGPFDAICAFNVLHLVDDLPGLVTRLRACLAPGGVLISKTWCFGDLPLHVRVLMRGMRLVGLFPPARFLTRGDLLGVLAAGGFVPEEERVFGSRPQSRYIVARAVATEDAAPGVDPLKSQGPTHD